MSKVPTKETRAEWRRLAEATVMTSAVGEYTPDEFVVLLDAVEELEAENRVLRAAVEAAKGYLEGLSATEYNVRGSEPIIQQLETALRGGEVKDGE